MIQIAVAILNSSKAWRVQNWTAEVIPQNETCKILHKLQDQCRLITFAKYRTVANNLVQFHFTSNDFICWIHICIFACCILCFVGSWVFNLTTCAPQMMPAETASPERPTRWRSVPGSAPRRRQPGDYGAVIGTVVYWFSRSTTRQQELNTNNQPTKIAF